MANKTAFDSWVKKRGAASASFRAELRAARAHIDSVDGVVRALDAARVEMGLSKAELARAVGMMPESMRRLFTMKAANPSIDTVVKLADALGLELTFTRKPAASRRKNAARASA
jgi:DNA-binding phage protein